MSETVRAHLEAIRDWHSGDASELGGRTVSAAIAALDLLDKARVIEGRYYGNSPYIWFKDGERIRLISDPEAIRLILDSEAES